MGPQTKNLEIERLRAIAVIMTVMVHATFLHPLLSPLLCKSYTGVDLFFVISGYVVSKSFLRTLPAFSQGKRFRDRIRMAAPALRCFYLRRVFRILPAAFLWMGVYFLLAVTFENRSSYLFGTTSQLRKEIFYFCSGFYNYLRFADHQTPVYYLGPYWSLTVEEHFYVLLPWLLLFASTRRGRILGCMTGILLVIGVLRPLFVPSPEVVASGFNIFASHRRFDTLLLGVLIALVWPGGKEPAGSDGENTEAEAGALFRFANLSIRNLPAIFLIAGLWLSPALLPVPFDTNLGLTIYAIFGAGLVYLASLRRGFIFEIPIIAQFLEYLGSRSYAVYLSHMAAIALRIQFLNGFQNNFPAWFLTSSVGLWLQFALTFALIIALSEATYRFVELPFMSIGQRFRWPEPSLDGDRPVTLEIAA